MNPEPFYKLLEMFAAVLKVLYYVFYPFIWLFIHLWPAIKYLRYVNPWLWWCATFHGVKWERIFFMAPFGIGGGSHRIGWWCKKCQTMYCGHDD